MDLSALRDLDELELVEIDLDRLLVDMESGSICILKSEGKNYLQPINAIEGTILALIQSKCYNNTYTPTIYHVYLHTMQSLGYVFKKSIISAKEGDVYFAACCWERKNVPMYQKCSFGDAIAIALINNAKCFATLKALGDMEEFNISDIEEL